ncbi:MAG: hypothetical protein JW982_07435 [Spirochaetes bacterium]|nr:hypothetical protein [Spirochaetota bacterium]
MSNYFILDNQLPEFNAKGYMEIEDWNDIEGFDDWGEGIEAKDKPAGDIEIDVVSHDGYNGLPPDLHDHSVPLISARMKTALDAAGVENIKYLPVTLKNPETNQKFEYFAFNLIGLISAADFSESDIKSPDGDFTGDSQIYDLVIDEDKIPELLIFRLAEKFSAVVVHSRVKAEIEKHGIDTLRFLKPEDYMAL